MSATARLAGFAARMATAALPREVGEKAVCCLLDAIGVGLLARQEHTFLAVSGLIGTIAPVEPHKSAPGQPACAPNAVPGARVWADGKRAALADAVLANAVAVHGQFHDDTDYSSWTHPASLVVPVAVSLAEARGASVLDAVRAVAAGYNALVWLGGSDSVARAIIDRGMRPSPTLGTIAAAATSVALLQLDTERATHAIGMAACMTGGVLEPVRGGSDEWRIQNARAATGGLLAAQLAERGVSGASAGLEGPRGLLAGLAGMAHAPRAWAEPPALTGILGVVAKPYATLGDNMSAVIAAKLIHDQGIAVADIARIDILIWRHFTEYPGTAYRGPFDRVTQAVASMAFGTAAMLVHGELEYDKPLAHREDPAILRLMPLIHIEPDDAGSAYDATVAITLMDGTRIAQEARNAGSAMLRHDRATSIALFERRLAGSGYAAGAGHAMAAALFDELGHATGLSMHEWLDGLARPGAVAD